MTVNDIVYYARVVPQCDIYETLQLTIRTASDGWYVGVDNTTRQAFPFDEDSVGVFVFSYKADADEVVKSAKKEFGIRKLTKIKEEEDDGAES